MDHTAVSAIEALSVLTVQCRKGVIYVYNQ